MRNLIIFTGMALGVGWIGRGLDVLMGSPAGESLGMLLWLVAPATTALLLRAVGGDGWKDAGLRPNVRGNVVWYGVALIVYPILTLLVVVVGVGLGQITLPGFSFQSLARIGQTFGVGLVPQLLKNVFEESAWRGYLAPRVYALGLRGYSASYGF
jgi:hypothetical protein